MYIRNFNNFNIFITHAKKSFLLPIYHRSQLETVKYFLKFSLDINLSNYKNERLIYPQSGDSGFYQGTGRRHYESSIKQLIFKYLHVL